MPRKHLRHAVLGFFPSRTKLMKLISEDLFGLYDEISFLVVLIIHKGLLSCPKLKRT